MVFAFAGDSTITKFFAIYSLFEAQKYRIFLNIAVLPILKVNFVVEKQLHLYIVSKNS
ncbi:hypothetical protein FCR2A7T_16260 [Flavobacterium cauense R2A-7]|nr:hypothetical protein FCR2A7T_16260 [Flavobacterium cauense R2A-7]